MNYIITIHLEHEEDVIRHIEIPGEENLETLHYAIIRSLNLDSNEMASFYITNEEFELIEEIPLYNFDEKDTTLQSMNKIKISSVLTKKENTILYIYDFIKMWRFLVTFSKESNSKKKSIKYLEKVGDMPNVAPEIKFEETEEFDPFSEASEDFDEFKEYDG
tara:strand:- start:4749 stop:5234 length:486 start_codon:yes stop_codon:yes gene_type:complete